MDLAENLWNTRIFFLLTEKAKISYILSAAKIMIFLVIKIHECDWEPSVTMSFFSIQLTGSFVSMVCALRVSYRGAP